MHHLNVLIPFLPGLGYRDGALILLSARGLRTTTRSLLGGEEDCGGAWLEILKYRDQDASGLDWIPGEREKEKEKKRNGGAAAGPRTELV